MAKYLMLWEMDWSRIPSDPKERGARWAAMLEMTRQDLKKGLLKDWGTFAGSNGGYGIGEGTEMELMVALQKYIPFITFKTYPVLSVEQSAEVLKSLPK